MTPLTKFINRSFERKIFPRALKFASIIVIHKARCKSYPSNYRPLFLLSIFPKIFEKPFHSRLADFFAAKIFFHDHQFGFRSKLTEQACFGLLTFVNNALDLKRTPAAIILDMRKAFNNLSYDILLAKFPHFGI